MGRNPDRNRSTKYTCRRPPCEGVGRNSEIRVALQTIDCRPPCEGVGRNPPIFTVGQDEERRPPCEGVGRNSIMPMRVCRRQRVALHVRAWVEIGTACAHTARESVALHVRAWVEIGWRRRQRAGRWGRPPCEGVGRNSLPSSHSTGGKASPSM